MNRRFVIAFLLVAALVARANPGDWRCFGEGDRYSGRVLPPSSAFHGRVVLVVEWGMDNPASKTLLPRLEKVWKERAMRPFFLIASHRQGRRDEPVAKFVKDNVLTFPVYENIGFEGEPDAGGNFPFFYILGTSGRVIFSGTDEKKMLAALDAALADVADPECFVEGLPLKKLRNYRRSLVYGKDIDAQRSVLLPIAWSQDDKNPTVLEARSMIGILDETVIRVNGRIHDEITGRPAAALQEIGLYNATWPTRQRDFDKDLKTLRRNGDARKVQKFAAEVRKIQLLPVPDPGKIRQALRAAEDCKRANAPLAKLQGAVAPEVTDLFADLDQAIAAYNYLLAPPAAANPLPASH